MTEILIMVKIIFIEIIMVKIILYIVKIMLNFIEEITIQLVFIKFCVYKIS